MLGTVPNAYTCALLLGVVLTRSSMLVDARFSLRKFYLLMGWAPLTFVALALLVDPKFLLFFVVAGTAGILGELLVSVAYRWFFDEPIWTYSYRSVLRGYTSTLNFLPWAVGAFLFLLTGRIFGGAPKDVSTPIVVAGAAVLAGFGVAWAARRLTSSRPRRFTRRGFALFCLPIAATAFALGAVCGVRYPLLMTAFAVVGFATEYGYGRGMSLLFERGLWTYNHWQIDGGHTSFVTLPLWALGGLYFHLIAGIVGL